jgi:excisionase family DNA binding protein
MEVMDHRKLTKPELVKELGAMQSRLVELEHALALSKRTQANLQAERDRFEMVAQSIGAGLSVISRDYRIIWVNENISKMLGEVRGKTCYAVMNKRTEVCPGCCVKELFEAGRERVLCEQIVSDRKGNAVHLNVIATPIKDEKGDVTAALEMVIPTTGSPMTVANSRSPDVNEGAKAGLRELDELRSEFVSFLTDGFKSVLASRATSKRWMSLDDVAAYLGIKRDTAYKWIKRKRMPAHKVGRLWKFRQSEIDEWLQSKQSE